MYVCMYVCMCVCMSKYYYTNNYMSSDTLDYFRSINRFTIH